MEIGAIPGNSSPAIVFPAMYIIALGTGGIKPNVCTMGADQFDDRYSRDRKEKESFFNWFYWSINLASLISYTLVAYICQNGIPALGGEEWGFFAGYMIPCVMMALAIIVFVSGTPKYTMLPPRGSVLADSAKVVWEALWIRRNVSSKSLASPHQHVLDKANKAYGGSFTRMQVEGVKLVARLSPFLLALIPYWGLYSQMNTAFQNQGCQMNMSMGTTSVPVSALNVFDSLAIVALVPLFDGYIYPTLKEKGFSTSMLQKMGAGFLFTMVAMLTAAVVEVYRVRLAPTPGGYDDVSARDNITPCQNIDDYNPQQYQDWLANIDDADEPAYCHQTCSDYYVGPSGVLLLNMTCIDCDDIPQMSNMSIFWQIPQFVLVGVSEILASVTALEFFYTQAPLPMRSVSQALNLLTTAIGSWLTIPLLYLVNSNPNDEWVPVNLDDGHLDYYFLLLAALMCVNMIYFYYISKDYVYKTQDELKLESGYGSDGEEEEEDMRRGLVDTAVDPSSAEKKRTAEQRGSSGLVHRGTTATTTKHGEETESRHSASSSALLGATRPSEEIVTSNPLTSS